MSAKNYLSGGFLFFTTATYVGVFLAACGSASKSTDGACSSAFLADYQLVNQRTVGTKANFVHPELKENETDVEKIRMRDAEKKRVSQQMFESAKRACDRFYSRHADVSCNTTLQSLSRPTQLRSEDLRAQCDEVTQAFERGRP